MSENFRCISCEEIELANVHDALPSQLMPIPHEALAGFPQGRDGRALTRRRLLQYGAAGVASVYGPRLLKWESVWESAAAAASAPDRVLVVIYLAGGQDGLNVVPPGGGTDYSTYVAKRPVIHRGQGATVAGRVGSQPMPGSGGLLSFANPVVSSAGGGDNGDANFGFERLYGDGLGGPGSNLAVMPATDYLPANLSHFTSSDYWFGGRLVEPFTTGWLGRWLDLYGSPSNPLQGISLGSSLSKTIRTAAVPVCTISSLAALGFALRRGGYGSPGGDPAAVDANAVVSQLAGLPVGDGANTHLLRSRASYAQAVDIYNQTSSLGPPVLGGGYPTTGSLSPQLKLAAFLLGANLGTRVITIHWGGFDTHGGQIASQDPQLKELSRALGAFQADLAARGVADRVSTLLFSEFGRRVAENASAGTDHGAGGLMLAAGPHVRGGLAAPFTGLQVDQQGDVAVGTDFRSVYQSVIGEWLGGDPAAVLGGSFPPLQRYDGTSGLFA
ncbi:MAG: DUF1501 domain-containing protein [Solirubrobacteraceae bacterium]